jgi:hypothetical protein
LLAQREVLNPNVRLLGPLPIGVLCNEVAVGIDGVGASRVLPVPIFTELRDAGARLRGQLALGMALDELTVSLDRVRRFRRTPILLLAAAACRQQQ